MVGVEYHSPTITTSKERKRRFLTINTKFLEEIRFCTFRYFLFETLVPVEEEFHVFVRGCGE